MFLHKTDRGFKQLFRYSHLPAPHIQKGIVQQGEIQAPRMRHPLPQRDRLAAPGQRLVRIPKPPQSPARTGEAYDARVSPTTESQVTALLEIIESNPLLQMRVCRGEIARHEQGRP